MTVVLDTDILTANERGAAAFGPYEEPQRLRLAAPARPVRQRMRLLGYGPGVKLLHSRGSGLVVDRAARLARRSGTGQLALFASRSRRTHLRWGVLTTTYAPGRLSVVEATRPYPSAQGEVSDHYVLIIDGAQTGLDAAALRRADGSLARSPVYPMLCAHFTALCEHAADLGPDAMQAIGRATAELARATILTSVAAPGAAECPEETLFVRMADYAERTLHDPQLTPARIAAEHFVSVRYLYKVWERSTGESPHRWIMTRRLRRAGTLLAERPRSTLPISVAARQCGFTNMSHFSRRFRQTYGLTPRDWSLRHRQG